MNIHRYHYGASTQLGGIGQIAYSPALWNTNVKYHLTTLSSLHCESATMHEGERLMYFLNMDGYNILGLSWTESPQSSGYNRSAPCGIQYLFGQDDLYEVAQKLPELINFMSFDKPAQGETAPISAFPMITSGYYQKSDTRLRAALVDACLKAATGSSDALLIIMNPDRGGLYALARYLLADVFSFIPISCRGKLSFFTGVPRNFSDNGSLAGDNPNMPAQLNEYPVKLICVTPEQARALRRFRSYDIIDTTQLKGDAGAFARFIVERQDANVVLEEIESMGLMRNSSDYASINQIPARYLDNKDKEANQLKNVRNLQAQLRSAEARNQELEMAHKKQDAQIDALKDQLKDVEALKQACERLEREFIEVKAELKAYEGVKAKCERLSESYEKLRAQTAAYAQLGKSKTKPASGGQPSNPLGRKPVNIGNQNDKHQRKQGEHRQDERKQDGRKQDERKQDERKQDDKPVERSNRSMIIMLIAILLVAAIAVYFLFIKDAPAPEHDDTTTPSQADQLTSTPSELLASATDGEATISEATISEATISEATNSEATNSEATNSEVTNSEATISEATISEATNDKANIEEIMFETKSEANQPQETDANAQRRNTIQISNGAIEEQDEQTATQGEQTATQGEQTATQGEHTATQGEPDAQDKSDARGEPNITGE